MHVHRGNVRTNIFLTGRRGRRPLQYRDIVCTNIPPKTAISQPLILLFGKIW